MRIVITGALGHLGSALIRSINSIPNLDSVIAIDNMSTQRYCTLFNFYPTYKFELIEANLESLSLNKILSGADCVIHLAALTEPELSVKDPHRFRQTNFDLTSAVSQAAAACHVPMIFPSTTSVYVSTAQTQFCEPGAPQLDGQTPYAQGKLKEELRIAQTFEATTGRYSILRLATLCGYSPGMRFHTAVNRFCWQAANGLPLTVYEDTLSTVRPYLAIQDAVGAIERVIMDCNYSTEAVNVFSESLPMRSIISLVSDEARRFGLDVKIREIPNLSRDQGDVLIQSNPFVRESQDAILFAVRDTFTKLARRK